MYIVNNYLLNFKITTTISQMKFLLILFSLQTFAQVNNMFSVKGFTNISSEKIFLLQPFNKNIRIADDKYQREFSLKPDNKYSFQGDIKYPSYFLLVTDDDVSPPFFLDNTKNQEVNRIKDTKTSKIIIDVKGSKSNEEYINLKKIIEESYVEDLLGNNDVNKGIEDYILLDYIKKHPSSYVALWLLIRKFADNNPNRYQKKALSYFSDSIKSTELYNNFIKEIETKELFIENIKNGFILKNTELKNENIILKNKNKNKYIMIDFWFSYCAPCLAEMPKYLQVYDKYKDIGFSVIGISTDRKEDIGNWKKIIADKNIHWLNYWDENSDFSKKLGVSKFPTNFLFDTEGNIIYRDISAEKLDEFLIKKLKENE